jgi:hypothetical protein
MHPTVAHRLTRLFALAALFAAMATPAYISAQDAQPAAPLQPDQPASHTPPVTAKINALAHRVLLAGVKGNTLLADGLEPWHIKIDFQLVQFGVPKPIPGTVEEWSTGRPQWRRTYTSRRPSWNGSEWGESAAERYRTKTGAEGFEYVLLNTRVLRPVIDPLYQAANIKPDYEMEIKRVNTAGVALNCVSVADPARYTDGSNPDFLFPTMCFDSDMHLRLTVSGATSVQFDDIQVFQGKAVARDVKVIQRGELIAEMKVSVLEIAPVEPAQIRAPQNAVREPYTIEPGQPRVESVHEEAASIPMGREGLPTMGSVSLPVVIQKDGSVKIDKETTPMMSQNTNNLLDSVEIAVSRWKYKPYLLDGQPVEVGIMIVYPLDGKPFVPSYDRPKPPKVTTTPEDFTSSYDPKRDPAKDLEMAKTQAKKENKRILLDVGGDWCYWCKALDKFYAEHTDLRDMRDQNFVLMKVNMSSLNENYAFLSKYPNIPGYPWIFVLDADGNLVKSEDTNGLEDGAKGYSAKAIKEFLAANKPPPSVASTQ